MTRQRVFLGSCYLICSGTIGAQSIDTVHHDNPDFPYSVVGTSATGTPHGTSHTYGRNGELRRTVHYSNGVLHGPEIRYHENGQMSMTAFIEKGKYHGTSTNYYPVGGVRSTLEYRKGLFHGVCTYYYENGQVSMTLPFKNGQIHGTSEQFHSNGNIKWVKGYMNGMLHGERIAWDSTGKPMEGHHTFEIDPHNASTFTVLCINGRPEGDIMLIHPDGRVIFTGNYVHGLPDGEWIYYERTGLVDRVDVYKKGRFKETRRSYN